MITRTKAEVNSDIKVIREKHGLPDYTGEEEFGQMCEVVREFSEEDYNRLWVLASEWEFAAE